MRDLFNNISTVQALAPAVQTAAVSGATIDTLTASRAAFVVNTGAVAGSGDFGAKLQESDDGTTWTDVAGEQVQTNAPATLVAASVYKLGYLGWKRYVRVALTKAGGTSIAAGAVAVLSPFERPAA